MKTCNIFFSFICLVIFCGCSVIGNGITHTEKTLIYPAESVDIKGDMHVEIICNAEKNSAEIIIDENLRKYLRINASDDLDISLASGVKPMVLPRVKICLQKSFEELSMEGASVCKIVNFKSANELEIELSDSAVCTFTDIKADNVKVELEERSKLSLKGKVGNLNAEIKDRAVLEVSNIENFNLECSNTSITRIDRCNFANVEAENNAAVNFKKIKSLRQYIKDDARIDYPIEIPENLKK